MSYEIVPLIGIESIAKERSISCFDKSHSVCTKDAPSLNNGVGMGKEVFENGLSVGFAMAQSGRNAYTFELEIEGTVAIFYILTSDADQAVDMIKSWPTDEYLNTRFEKVQEM